MSRRELLQIAADHANAYLDGVAGRPVRATISSHELRRLLDGPLPGTGDAPERVITALAEAGVRGTVATQGPRYFGFVIGGCVPASTAAEFLVAAWDQNSGVYALSPAVSVIEEVTAAWLLDLAGLPAHWSTGFVTGCQMASFTALAAARHHVLEQAGWDVGAQGLFGAPPIDVVVSDESHYTIFTALRMLGLGSARLRRIATDGQGRMIGAELATALRGGDGSGRAVRRACTLRRHARRRAARPRPQARDRRSVARLPHGSGRAEGGARASREAEDEGHGRRRDRGQHVDGLVRRSEQDRRQLRQA